MLVRVIFPTLLVFIPTLIIFLAEPSKYAKPFFYALFAILVIFALLHSYFVQYKQHLRLNQKYVDLIIESLFQNVLHIVKASVPKLSSLDDISQLPYRVNIIKPKFNISPFKKKENFFKTCLFIRHHYNMKGHPDLNITLHPGRGVAGKAYKEKQPKIGDAILMSQPGADDWTLTKEEKDLTKDIKSIISVPILPILEEENKNKVAPLQKVIGVLSIDSTEELKNTPFQNADFQAKIEEVSKRFYGLLV